MNMNLQNNLNDNITEVPNKADVIKIAGSKLDKAIGQKINSKRKSLDAIATSLVEFLKEKGLDFTYVDQSLQSIVVLMYSLFLEEDIVNAEVLSIKVKLKRAAKINNEINYLSCIKKQLKHNYIYTMSVDEALSYGVLEVQEKV